MKRAARHFWDRQAGTRPQPEPVGEVPTRPARGGFSLIEVVVALLIFVIGALAVIKIFPPGLGVVQNSQEVGVASNMSQSLVNSYAAIPNTVPYSVYFATTAGSSSWTDLMTGVCASKPQVTATPTPGPLPTDVNNQFTYLNSALGQPSYITGERETVQQSEYIGVGLGASTLTPFITTKFRYTETSAPVVYHEDDIRGVTIDVNGNLNFTNATLASSGATFNAGGASANLPPTGSATIGPGQYESATPTDTYSTTYYVSYHWSDANSYLNGVLDEPLQYPVGGALPAVQINPVAVTGSHVVPGPVAARVRWVIFSQANTDDSHTGFVNLSSVSTANTGMAYLSGTGLVQGDTVSVDYAPDDWRWLVEDNKPAEAPSVASTPVPSAGPTPSPNEASVYLPVGFLDSSQFVYTLLTAVTPGSTTPITQASFWNGEDNCCTSDLSSKPALAYVIHQTGEVAFSPGDNVQARSRVVYQTLDGWARQPAVAARAYYPYITGGANLEEWRQYCLGTDGNLYFHPSEAGKTVAVSLTYLIGGQLVTRNDMLLPISPDIGAPPGGSGVPAGFGTTGLVAEAEPFDAGSGTNVAALAILGVKGLSITARTAWISNGDYTDVRVDGYRKVSTQ